MTQLFKSPKTPEISNPRTIRMPGQDDPSLQSAAQRTRQNALQRRGRLSTIMTDMTKTATGSSGAKLGA